MTDTRDCADLSAIDSGLTMGLDLDDGVVGLAFVGILDAGSVTVVDVLIDQLACTSFHTVVVDVTGVRGVDDVGLNVLTGLRYYLQGRGATVQVRGGFPLVVEALAARPLEVQVPTPPPAAQSALRPPGRVSPAF